MTILLMKTFICTLYTPAATRCKRGSMCMSESIPTPSPLVAFQNSVCNVIDVMLSTSRVWMHAWMPKRSMRRMVMST